MFVSKLRYNFNMNINNLYKRFNSITNFINPMYCTNYNELDKYYNVYLNSYNNKIIELFDKLNYLFENNELNDTISDTDNTIMYNINYNSDNQNNRFKKKK